MRRCQDIAERESLQAVAHLQKGQLGGHLERVLPGVQMGRQAQQLLVWIEMALLAAIHLHTIMGSMLRVGPYDRHPVLFFEPPHQCIPHGARTRAHSTYNSGQLGRRFVQLGHIVLARKEEIYKAERFSDHAPLTIHYEGLL